MALHMIMMYVVILAIQIEADKVTNQRVTELHGGEEVAQRVAGNPGYMYGGQVKLAEREDLSRGFDEESQALHTRYKQEDMDELMQLTYMMDKVSPWDKDRHEEGSCLGNFFRVLFGNGQGNMARLGTISTNPRDFTEPGNTKGPTQHVQLLSKKISAYASRFNDALWKYQWYLQDYRVKDIPVMDHNIVPVYKMGYTGKGVKVAVLDNGVVHDHPDLQGNYDASLSYDTCVDTMGSEPDTEFGTKIQSHGTRCAGVIAMVADNEICGVGIAYNARVAGIKVICNNRIYDVQIGRALTVNVKEIDIYVNSWGRLEIPMEPLPDFVRMAFISGIYIGRDNKGAIHLFSSGSIGEFYESCSSSATANHYATITIAGATQKGKIVEYSMRCTAVFATAYTGGSVYEERVVSTMADGSCTRGFSGTSASQAIAAGIIALVLEANNDLTFRDVMHLITMSAEVAPLANNQNTWKLNGRGLWVSSDFGFGLLNAENMVNLAKKWKTVPKMHICVVEHIFENVYEFLEDSPAVINIYVDACVNDPSQTIYYLEQLQISPIISYPFRGALSIDIKSPAGTKSKLLEVRPGDISNEGLSEWNFKSVHNWGEDPNGEWVIEVKVNHIKKWHTTTGYVSGFIFTFYGTAEMPEHYSRSREYSAFRLPRYRSNLY